MVNCLAQNEIEASNEFTIEGLVETPLVIHLDSFDNHVTTEIDSLIITNHLGQRKSTLKNLRVIPIRAFLSQVKIKVDNPKYLSEFYFVFIATDGYKVVFSWNELFNNPIGKEIFIIIEKNKVKIDKLEDRISIFSRTDVMTGRRYVKSLKKIVVQRVN